MISSLGLFVTVQDSCNFDCAFCQFPPKKEFRSGKSIDYNKFIDFIASSTKREGEFFVPLGAVSFCGSGEPLLYEKIAEIIGETKKYVPFISLVTNGGLLDRTMSEILLETGVDHIVISITGNSVPTYKKFQGSGKRVKDVEEQFDLVRSNIGQLVHIRNAKRKKTQIGVSYLLNDDSKDDYFKALENWKRMGIDYVDTRMRQRGFSHKLEDYDAYVSENSMYWENKNCCTCFGKVMNIFTDGRISYCNCVEDDKLIGNIYEKSFSEIINTKKFRDMFEYVTHDYSRMPDTCKTCDMLRARPILT